MQERLNVFLLTDVEGISGIDSIDVMDREAPVYESTRTRLCEEINLAVKAALEAVLAAGNTAVGTAEA